MTVQKRAALDEAQTVLMAMEAVSDLLVPETNLNVVSRDNLCTLISLLNRQMRSALDSIETAKA